jgi:hypothetical protein
MKIRTNYQKRLAGIATFSCTITRALRVLQKKSQQPRRSRKQASE